MRNCFVPKCDSFCKDAPRRMMFMAPKDLKLFEKWKAVLPKKREFKRTDKVCERHFVKADIQTTFDHVINGELLQMERDRPRLKPTAIPTKNLDVNLSEKPSTKRSTTYKGSLQSKRRKAQENPSTKFDDEVITNRENTKEIEEHNALTPNRQIKELPTEQKGADESNECNDSITLEQFEILYDDIFDVTLPSTLWGIHREPDRKFMAFTCFDLESMGNTKCVVLTCSGCMKIIVNGKKLSEQVFTDEIAPAFISNVLNEVEETNFCRKAGENCNILADPDSECCSNCA